MTSKNERGGRRYLPYVFILDIILIRQKKVFRDFIYTDITTSDDKIKKSFQVITKKRSELYPLNDI